MLASLNWSKYVSSKKHKLHSYALYVDHITVLCLLAVKMVVCMMM